MNAYRSILFVPGSRSDRFDKAVASGADAVAIDLEDAVAPHLKGEARRQTLEYLTAKGHGPAAVGFRINAISSIESMRDLVAFADSGAAAAFLMIPKANHAAEIEQVRAALGHRCPPFIPLIEDPHGLAAAPAIARAVGEAGGLMFGGADYSASIGADMGWDALAFARGAIVAAAAAAGCAAIDVPYLDVADEAGMRAETMRVRAMGFSGRACIHPSQTAAINEIFAPSADEVAKAQKIAAAYAQAEGGVALLDGKLIEKPVLRAAERILNATKGRN
jgi:citrate lyase subunit beta/citryl-CoA lyase/(S)-citramalyl-CoA lyase